MDKPKRILIAEDEPGDMKLIQIVLRDDSLENEAAFASDGEEALDYLYCRGSYSNRPPGNPDLALLDLKLPKVNGLEILKAMKNDEHFREIPVVIFTSSLDERDREESLSGGADSFVTKPIDFRSYRNALKKIISAYVRA